MPADLQSRELFERCISQHADSLYRVAYRLSGRRELAEELVQETYLNAWNGIESLADVSKMRGWMFAILRNQYSKMVRRDVAKSTVTEFPVTEIANPESHTDDGREQIQIALERLGEDQKLPLLLVVMEGLTVNEAAEVLQIPRGTVLSRLHRGKQKLKQILSAETIQPTDPVDTETKT